MDFCGLHPNVNPNAFTEVWPEYGPKIRKIAVGNRPAMRFTTWLQDIEDILLLLKLFPIKKNNASKKFLDSTKDLIVYVQVRHILFRILLFCGIIDQCIR